MEDPFLGNLWKDLASHTNEGLDFEDLEKGRGLVAKNAYLSIKRIGEHSKLAMDLVKGTQESIVRYIKTIDKLSAAKIKKDDPEEMGEADLARRLTHNALISNLNILNRYCLKNNLDTSWKNVIGSDRNQVRDWALTVAPEIIEERIG